jgi:phosphoribosyl 1,2-cyclic phosphodiesterase
MIDKTVKVIASSSKGNAMLYYDSILVDCGVPYSTIKPYIKKIGIVLLTHEHGDHFNLATLKRMQQERPSLRIACCDHLSEQVKELRNVDILRFGEYTNYRSFAVCPIKLYHDVPNVGFRIQTGFGSIIHATDTSSLDGIEAKGYDYFCIESNYDEETIHETIKDKQYKGLFCHEIGKINSHLSEQQCISFFNKNKHSKSQLIRLHQ